ncbi:MAG: ferritin-like domain-containing protein [Cellulomonadaceae bacterium]|nr:ferritin-like domain-containing protein [Cellulomonadaceae bacterium]
MSVEPQHSLNDTEQQLIDLAGLGAYARLRLFCLVASLTWDSPSMADAQRLMRRSVSIAGQQEALAAIGQGYGYDAETLMAPYDGLLDGFISRTEASDWWEGLLKGLIVHGVARDLVRLLATGISGQGEAVAALLADDDDEDRVGIVDRIAAACADDTVLASRLALWGRRVVGEAFMLGQGLMRSRPRFLTMAVNAAQVAGVTSDDGGAPDAEAVKTYLLAELTSAHARRMDAMGLAA